MKEPEEEERVLRENAENGLQLPQARQRLWDQARAIKFPVVRRTSSPRALRHRHSGSSSSCKRSYHRFDARNPLHAQVSWSGDAPGWGNDPRCSRLPRARSMQLPRAGRIATTPQPNKTMQPRLASALCGGQSTFVPLRFNNNSIQAFSIETRSPATVSGYHLLRWLVRCLRFLGHRYSL
jgi:hypothetical protein